MKFYATIESNRAKKGQGGDYLNIEIFTTSKEQPTHRVRVSDNATTGDISLILQAYHFGKWRDTKAERIFTEAKAKKQTGGICKICNVRVADNVEVHNHYTKAKKQTGETCPECGSAINEFYSSCSNPACEYTQ